MITASHNPPDYNGIKVYGADGAQLIPQEATTMMQCIAENKTWIECLNETAKNMTCGHIYLIDDEIEQAYFSALEKLKWRSDEQLSLDIPIVFTSLHGTGATLFPKLLRKNGFCQVHLVKEQCIPDPMG